MPKSIKNIKILIVEDDKDICELYSTAFMREGFKVFKAMEGKGAIEKYQQKNPDIILLDIMMPGVDGYEVLKEVRKRHDKYVPVVMLTNLDMGHFTRHETVDNVDDYLIKSNYTPSEIVERTKEIMRMNKVL
ncbi:response regulator [Candidatus Peregrinibacteria bacterium]|nr:response regulator [Candidatus Peregrinibacteria bacterium]